jgi:hypothetical protein
MPYQAELVERKASICSCIPYLIAIRPQLPTADPALELPDLISSNSFFINLNATSSPSMLHIFYENVDVRGSALSIGTLKRTRRTRFIDKPTTYAT